jgi:hypothetical protein
MGDNLSSTKDEDNINLNLQLAVHEMEFNLVKTEESLQIRIQPLRNPRGIEGGDITAKEGGNKEIANGHGIYVENLEYDSDMTKELLKDDAESVYYEVWHDDNEGGSQIA